MGGSLDAGTENTAGITGFGVAAELAVARLETFSQTTALRDSIEATLLPICAANGLAFHRLVQSQIFLGDQPTAALHLLRNEASRCAGLVPGCDGPSVALSARRPGAPEIVHRQHSVGWDRHAEPAGAVIIVAQTPDYGQNQGDGEHSLV